MIVQIVKVKGELSDADVLRIGPKHENPSILVFPDRSQQRTRDCAARGRYRSPSIFESRNFQKLAQKRVTCLI